MNIIETAKGLIKRDEVKEASNNVLEDSLNVVVTGNPVSAAKILKAFIESPFFIRDQIFWTNFEVFLSGLYTTEDDRLKFCAKLAENGKQQENALRIIECVARVETKRKAKYLANAGRSVSANFISLEDFFRICHAIINTIDEDLKFLAENIQKSDIDYSINVQGLLSSGLMHQSVIDATGEQKYSFTPLAELVDRFSVSFENVDRYPDPTQKRVLPAPHVSVAVAESNGIQWQEISDDQITALFKDK